MKVVTKQDGTGRLIYSSEILTDIVHCALDEVKGVVRAQDSRKISDDVRIEQIGDRIEVDVFVKLLWTVEVSDVASRLQNTIKSTIESMTEFRVKDVNLHVIGVEVNEN